MPTGYTNFLEEVKKSAKSDWDKQLADNDTFFANQANSINSNYDAQVNKEKTAYEDSYRENAIQKLINERQIAENMANLGLTNSGLNRTQQTAAQLSYANNKADIDRRKQSAIEDINLARTQALDTNEQNRMKNAMAINEGFESSIAETAQKLYDSHLTEVEKATKEAENDKPILTKLEYGTLAGVKNASNGNVTYIDTNGNSVTMRAGANPYTGDVNSDLLVSGKYDASRAFSNGYQPKYYKGKELTTYKPSKESHETSKSLVPWRTDGKEQQIFTTGSNKYYVWYGPDNRYVEARWNSSNEEWEFNIG